MLLNYVSNDKNIKKEKYKYISVYNVSKCKLGNLYINTNMIYNSYIHHTIILNIIASNSYLTEYVYTIFVLTREFELDIPLDILEGT